jgi:uncharacterized protein YneF (UPF0154 family)
MKRNVIAAIVLPTALLLGAITGISFAQKQNVPKPVDTPAMIEQHAKELMVLIKPDKEGMVTKEQWMKFMSEEFDRLDTNHDGKINQKDLQESMLWGSHQTFESLGK